MNAHQSLIALTAFVVLCTQDAWAQTKSVPLPRFSFGTCNQVVRTPVERPVSFAVGVTVSPDGTASNWRIGLGKGKQLDAESEILELLKSCRFTVPQDVVLSAPIEKRLHVYIAPARPASADAKAIPTFRCKAFPDYPAAAMRNNEQGVAAVDIHVNSDASLSVADLAVSTGSRWLDLASLPELEGYDFVPAVDESGKGKSGSTTYKKVWRLG